MVQFRLLVLPLGHLYLSFVLLGLSERVGEGGGGATGFEIFMQRKNSWEKKS